MAHLGLVGIGVMGSSFALNLAEEGHSVSMLDRSMDKMKEVQDKGKAEKLSGDLIASKDAQALIDSLPTPRTILVLVPSGKPLDSVIGMLKPLMDKGDMIADLGNSYFRETERRTADLESVGLYFLGMGISGGAEGARHGPSIMAGGSKESWARVEQPLRDAAAKFEDSPCVDWFGPGGSGHFIKMLHNGIEYADMQQITESYGLMRDGLGMQASEIADVFKGWMKGPLNSYLIEIAAEVAAAKDPKTGGAMLDMILDKAGQKGTGRWSVVEALHLGSPNSLIAAAVEQRNLSARKEQREEWETVFGASPKQLNGALGSNSEVVEKIENAMIGAKICAYVQGFQILQAASDEFEWNLNMGDISRVWRAGCIIRSVFLDEIASVFDADPKANLALSDPFKQHLIKAMPCLQDLVSVSVTHGVHVPALYAALSFFNVSRTGRGTANMIQGLRDRFGAHTFERLDDLGTAVNGPWHD